MANKNTKQMHAALRLAHRQGKPTLLWQRPVGDYHNDEHARFTFVSIPTACVNADGVNSVNRKRNSCQKLYRNQGPDQRTQSVTYHEAWVAHAPMSFPNHQYLKYRRPGGGSLAPALV
jgi:hypothetical protein